MVPHITPVSEADSTGATADLYQGGEAAFGYLPNMHRAFSLRPEYWGAWNGLLGAIKARMDTRRYEVATVGAAQALRSSYCSLAHGEILARDFLSEGAVVALIRGEEHADVSDEDREVFRFAQAVIRDASAITGADADRLRAVGLDDGEICDVTAAASVRCFFSKYLDALGFAPDAAFGDLPEALRGALVVGRAIEDAVHNKETNDPKKSDAND